VHEDRIALRGGVAQRPSNRCDCGVAGPVGEGPLTNEVTPARAALATHTIQTRMNNNPRRRSRDRKRRFTSGTKAWRKWRKR
jgi:hypothetical protein